MMRCGGSVVPFSNRYSSTPVAFSEERAKLTPAKRALALIR
jgi:hypothetical protein